MRLDGSKIVNPGLLRHIIMWQQKVFITQDSFGQDVYEWQNFVTVPSRVTALQGRELEAAQQRWAEARFKIESQYFGGIKRAMRGVWGDRFLDVIDAEDPWGTRMSLLIFAKEWAA